MRDDYNAGSPDRGRTEQPSQYRDDYDDAGYDDRRSSEGEYREGDYRDDDYYDDESYRSRHGNHSKSPSRRGYRSDYHGQGRSRDRNHHHQGRSDYGRGSNRPEFDQHDYEGMYDERSRRDNQDGGRDGGDHRGRKRRHLSRSRSRGRREDPGQPSDTIILEGLPTGPSMDELRLGLSQTLDDLQLPPHDFRLPQSRGGRRAFIQFYEIDHAAAFMKDHFPHFRVNLANPSDDVPDGQFNAYMHYARRREDENRVSARPNWSCPKCNYSNYSTRNRCKQCGTEEPVMTAEDNLTGVPDVGQEPSQILVVYPLPIFTSEEIFLSDIRKLEKDPPKAKNPSETVHKLKSTAPTNNPTGYGARPGSLHRVFLMRDARTQEFFKYGFVEFWTIEDAVAAMAKFQAATGFTVAGCPVNVGFTHMGVFVPIDHIPPPEEEYLSFRPLFNPEVRVRYRDHRIYPSQRIVTTEAPGASQTVKPKGEDNAFSSLKPKKRKTENDKEEVGPKKRPMGGQMAKWQQRHDELHEGAKKEEGEPKIKISLSNSLQLGAPNPSMAKPAPERSPSAGQEEGDSAGPSPEEAEARPVANHETLTCYLCMRQLKEPRFLVAHEKSEKHLELMKDEVKVKLAQEKTQRSLGAKSKTADASSSTSEYRDRAKERRTANGQPSKPKPVSAQSKGALGSKQDEAAAAAEAAAKANPGPSKGAAMLEKLGYKAGSGLGANGDGRVETIEANLYQEGVGLGAEGGNLGDAAKEAERKTKGTYKDYVESVHEKSRQRFQNL